MRAAQVEKIDLLSLEPFQELGSFSERLVIPTGLFLIAFTLDPSRVNDPARPEATANGQFLLFRREAYEAVGGFAAVRNAVCEDKVLAQAVKRGGFRLALWRDELIRVRMYTGLPSLFEGLAKNVVDMAGGPGATLAAAALALALGWASVGSSLGGRLLAGGDGRRRRRPWPWSARWPCSARTWPGAAFPNPPLVRPPLPPGLHACGGGLAVRGAVPRPRRRGLEGPGLRAGRETKARREASEAGMSPAEGERKSGRPRAGTLALAAAALLLIVYPLRYVLLPFAAAGGLAFVVSPAVRWLERRLRFPHPLAVVAVFIPDHGGAAALAYWMGVSIARQAAGLAADAPQLLDRMFRLLIGGDEGTSSAGPGRPGPPGLRASGRGLDPIRTRRSGSGRRSAS